MTVRILKGLAPACGGGGGSHHGSKHGSGHGSKHKGLEYIDHWSLALDCKILLRTIPAILTAEGAV